MCRCFQSNLSPDRKIIPRDKSGCNFTHLSRTLYAHALSNVQIPAENESVSASDLRPGCHIDFPDSSEKQSRQNYQAHKADSAYRRAKLIWNRWKISSKSGQNECLFKSRSRRKLTRFQLHMIASAARQERYSHCRILSELILKRNVLNESFTLAFHNHNFFLYFTIRNSICISQPETLFVLYSQNSAQKCFA